MLRSRIIHTRYCTCSYHYSSKKNRINNRYNPITNLVIFREHARCCKKPNKITGYVNSSIQMLYFVKRSYTIFLLGFPLVLISLSPPSRPFSYYRFHQQASVGVLDAQVQRLMCELSLLHEEYQEASSTYAGLTKECASLEVQRDAEVGNNVLLQLQRNELQGCAHLETTE